METVYNKTRPIIESKTTVLLPILSLLTAIILMSTFLSTNGAGPNLSTPDGVAVDSLGDVYVADTFNHRIVKFKLADPCPAGTTHVVTGVCFVTEWGLFGSSDGEFYLPYDIAVDSIGDVYVADLGNHRIQKFTQNGKFILKWGSEGSNKGQFRSPSGIAVDSIGDVYVADSGNNRIQKFSSDGIFETKWGSSANGQFHSPSDVAVDSIGDVYVADSGNNRIQKFKLANPCPSGTSQANNGVCFVSLWGTEGRTYGQFVIPWAIAVDSIGDVYVADSFNHRIQKFSSDGIFKTKWGSYGPRHGQFMYPFGVAVDSSGNIYVADTYNNRIEKYTNTGGYILTIPNPFAKVFTPVVTMSQKCLTPYVSFDYYSYSIQTKNMMGVDSFYFDPWTQDMAIFIDGKEISYGKNLGVGGTATYPPWFGLGSHTVLAFVEIDGDSTHNHRLDPGELSATTTFNTLAC
jgi:sugar lactone lactonase YvrE